MFVDLINLFSGVEDFKQVVLDNYRLGKGLYVIIDGSEIKFAEIVDKDQPDWPEYKWLKEADYYSQLVDMNKSVDSAKKIHSCNPFSMFIKADTLPGYGTGDKVLEMPELLQAIERYYGILCGDGKNDKYARQILESADLPELDKNLAQECKTWLLENLENIIKTVVQKSPPTGSYLKVFFRQELAKYAVECSRYLLPKIFNKNDYNADIDGEIYGLSNFNMGLNAKKPYLELMSTKFKVPFRISLKDSITLKCFFEWIEDYKTSDGKSADRSGMYLKSKSGELSFTDNLNNFVSGYFIHYKRGKEILIDDFEYLPFDPDEKSTFYIDNVLDVENWKYVDSYNIWRLEKIIDSVFFANRLISNYTIDTSDMKSMYTPGDFSKNLENIMLIYRKAIFNYFRKGDKRAFEYCVDAMSRSALLEILKIDESKSCWKAANAFNLRMALLKYFKWNGDEKMADFILELTEKARAKRDTEDRQPCCESDEEFFFVCGQLARYFFSLSEAAEPKHSYVERVIKCKDAKVLKKRLEELYIKYGHAINLNSMRFNNLLSMVVGFDTDAVLKEYEDYFLAGFLSKSLLYEKKEKKDKQEDDNNENGK